MLMDNIDNIHFISFTCKHIRRLVCLWMKSMAKHRQTHKLSRQFLTKRINIEQNYFFTDIFVSRSLSELNRVLREFCREPISFNIMLDYVNHNKKTECFYKNINDHNILSVITMNNTRDISHCNNRTKLFYSRVYGYIEKYSLRDITNDDLVSVIEFMPPKTVDKIYYVSYVFGNDLSIMPRNHISKYFFDIVRILSDENEHLDYSNILKTKNEHVDYSDILKTKNEHVDKNEHLAILKTNLSTIEKYMRTRFDLDKLKEDLSVDLKLFLLNSGNYLVDHNKLSSEYPIIKAGLNFNIGFITDVIRLVSSKANYYSSESMNEIIYERTFIINIDNRTDMINYVDQLIRTNIEYFQRHFKKKRNLFFMSTLDMLFSAIRKKFRSLKEENKLIDVHCWLQSIVGLEYRHAFTHGDIITVVI